MRYAVSAYDYSWQTVFKPGAADDFFSPALPGGFDPQQRGFSPTNAWWLSELSRLVYRRDHTEGVEDVTPRSLFLTRVGFVERRFFNRPGVQAMLVEHIGDDSAFAVLVFRGTAGRLANWRFNLDLAASPWPMGGTIHRGFHHLIMTIWDDIRPVLETVASPLFFAGHSLGGALATLAAAYFPPRAVYTFGAPRIGDADFAATLADISIFNVFNPNDIVTQLPPVGRKSRFMHAGTVVESRIFFRCRRLAGQAPHFLADHAPLNYSAQLSSGLEYRYRDGGGGRR